MVEPVALIGILFTEEELLKLADVHLSVIAGLEMTGTLDEAGMEIFIQAGKRLTQAADTIIHQSRSTRR